uniref:Uncharacterized protein n=1 Tax=Otus sunia TaxID=257818 RepID=A0A8C8AWI7_9STRI
MLPAGRRPLILSLGSTEPGTACVLLEPALGHRQIAPSQKAASASAMGQWLPRDGWICMQVLLIFSAIYFIFLAKRYFVCSSICIIHTLHSSFFCL